MIPAEFSGLLGTVAALDRGDPPDDSRTTRSVPGGGLPIPDAAERVDLAATQRA